MRILIIDDEESIRFTFHAHLSREGHETITAEDYASSLKIIAGTDLDLIITDIILGGYTGIDVLKQVKERGLNCPVIMITGEPNITTATDAVRLGAFDYLPKPVRKDTLLRVARHALRNKKLMDEKLRLEKENERYRRNLEAIFTSMKDAVISVDNDGRVIEANESARQICGFSPRDNIGKEFTSIRTRCSKPCHHALKETLETRDAIQERRVECGRSDRPRQVVLLTGSPLKSRDEGFQGAVLLARDITRLTDLERELKERHRFHQIVGKSRRMREIYRLLKDLADTETSVLVTGDSGTGKELVVRALHYEGPRAEKPLVAVNCAALAENLLESELFGHVKGAFTGAVKDKVGRFQMADGGTIFLDEIGDISPLIQLKLLRVLQEKEFERVGDSRLLTVDVRLIASTNRDLRKKVKLGEFREDLYYRLKVVEVVLPPLRERREDIPLMVDHFTELFSKRFGKMIDGVSEEVLAAFMRYGWPGNVRELEHAMEHAFVLCHDRTITLSHLPAEVKGHAAGGGRDSRKRVLDDPREILQALAKTDWNKAKTARHLGISRPTLYQKIKEFDLTPAAK
ncbi:MAG: response regulator [Desulfobacterales bacterium]|nr:response regulator [Desulfobacterales bacterium]